jgi:hypothetical protein
MYMKQLLLYFFALILIILGVYSFIYLKDYSSGAVWTVVGIFFMAVAYLKIRS